MGGQKCPIWFFAACISSEVFIKVPVIQCNKNDQSIQAAYTLTTYKNSN